MIKIVASVEFIGDDFKPGLAEVEGDYLFTEKSEVGDIGKLGVYKSKQTPFGYASLKVPPDVMQGERILWLANFLENKISLIRNYNTTLSISRSDTFIMGNATVN